MSEHEVGSGTDVARESAQVMLLGNDLLKLVETLRIARRCHRIIMANFTGTLVVDGAGVALAAFGFLSLPLSSIPPDCCRRSQRKRF